MEFTIYTAGGSEFLEIVLNACAMLTGSGSIDDMARVGAIIGVAILALQAVYRGAQGIEFHKVGLMLVCYMVFYGPVATTIVQDTTSDQVRVIDNIPVGPAFIGSLFSTVAYQITELSEQAWSTPGMTRYGLFSSLTTLTRVRDVLRNPVGLDQFQNYRRSEGWDLGRSFQEYMTYCNFNPVFLRNNMTVDQLYRAGDVGALLSNSSEAQSIYVYNQSPPQLMTCAAAGKVLTAALSDVLPLVMDDVMQKGFSDQVQSGQMTNFAQMQASLDNSLQSFGWSNKKASDYVASSLIQRYFSQGRVDALNHWQERRAAMALQQSLSQQEVQWAGKGDSFKFYIKPIMSFVEGLVYAVTPFMAMIMLMGGRGVASLMKFATLPLASGLCMPLLSFVNAFTLWYAGSKIQAILNGYDPISTGFAQMQLMDMDQALGTALGLGGYLASSVPVIAASIVGAGAMGVSSLMAGANSDAKFNSEDVQPRIQRPAPVLATEAHYTADQMSDGVSVTGAVNNAEQISGQQAASALVQSTKTASHTATQALQQTTQSAIQHAASTTQGQQVLSNLGHQVASNLNLSSNSQYTDAANRLKGLGWSESSVAAGTFAASVGAAAPFGIAGTKLEDSERYQKMSTEQQQQTRQAMSQLTSAVQASSTDQTVYNSAEAFSRSSQSVVSQSMNESLGKSLSDAKQAQEAYSTASKMESVFAASQSLSLKQAAVNSLGRGPSKAESAEFLKEMAGRTLAGRTAYENALKSNSVQSLSTDLNEKKAMAAIRAMNQDGRLGDLVNSRYSPFDFHLDKVDAQQNSHLAANQINTSELGARVQNGVNNAREAYASSNDMLASGFDAQKNDGEIVVGSVMDEHNNRVAESSDMNFGRLQAGNEDSPVKKEYVKVTSVTPVEDTTKNIVQNPVEAGKLAVGQLFDKAADVAGVSGGNQVVHSAKDYINNHLETNGKLIDNAADSVGVSKDNVAVKTLRNYLTHPVDSTMNAVHQITGALDSTAAPSNDKSSDNGEISSYSSTTTPLPIPSANLDQVHPMRNSQQGAESASSPVSVSRSAEVGASNSQVRSDHPHQGLAMDSTVSAAHPAKGSLDPVGGSGSEMRTGNASVHSESASSSSIPTALHTPSANFDQVHPILNPQQNAESSSIPVSVSRSAEVGASNSRIRTNHPHQGPAVDSTVSASQHVEGSLEPVGGSVSGMGSGNASVHSESASSSSMPAALHTSRANSDQVHPILNSQHGAESTSNLIQGFDSAEVGLTNPQVSFENRPQDLESVSAPQPLTESYFDNNPGLHSTIFSSREESMKERSKSVGQISVPESSKAPIKEVPPKIE